VLRPLSEAVYPLQLYEIERVRGPIVLNVPPCRAVPSDSAVFSGWRARSSDPRRRLQPRLEKGATVRRWHN
jgi:hypothetical protein